MTITSSADAIERMGFGLAQAKVLVGCGGVMLVDGAELLLLGSLTRAVATEWELNAPQRGMIVSIVFVGILTGNMIGGVLGDKIGRRWPIILAYAGAFVFSLLSVLAWNFTSIACIRFCAGFFFGVGGPALNSLCGEMTPSSHRMVMNAGVSGFFAIGEFYSAMLVYMQDPYMLVLSWRWLIALGTLPCLVFLVLSYYMLPESPLFLQVQGKNAEAQLVLEDVRRANDAPEFDMDLAADSQPRRNSLRRPSITLNDKFSIVLGQHMLYTTVVVCISTFTLNFVYYGGLYAFPQVLPDVKLHVTPAANLMVGSLFEFVGIYFGVTVGNHVTRKTCMLLYLLTTCTLTLIFGFAVNEVHIGNDQIREEMQYLVQLAFVGLKIFACMGFLIVYVYAAEIYPTVVRSTGGALCIGFGRLGSIIAPTVYEQLATHTGNHLAFFNLTAGICALNAILVLFLPYETQGIVLKNHFDEVEPIRASAASLLTAPVLATHNIKLP